MVKQVPEYVDLYDSNRLKLNKIIERKDKPLPGEYMVVTHALFINENDEILIQKRVPTKSLWPSLWDLSCSGALKAGETSQQGIEREIKEELGVDIDLTNTPPTLSASFDYGFSDYYVIPYTRPIEEFTPEPKEITDLKWVSQQELYKLLEEKQFVPYSPLFIEALFDLYQHQTEIRKE